jgi:hypothetical protein
VQVRCLVETNQLPATQPYQAIIEGQVRFAEPALLPTESFIVLLVLYRATGMSEWKALRGKVLDWQEMGRHTPDHGMFMILGRKRRTKRRDIFPLSMN